MARLSTHVLDTARGVPARGVIVDLHVVRGSDRQHIRTLTTNEDGRPGEPVLSGDRIETGVYELTFHAGEYFRACGVALSEPPFLDLVVIRFGISDPQGHYHVPLLLSPYGYSTYRGS
jgi:5-hydroxyisourate hydrolase